MKGLLKFALITAIALILFPESLKGQNDLENPKVFDRNKEAPHATLMPFSTIDNALTKKRVASVYYKTLSGTWKFNWVRLPADRPIDFTNLNIVLRSGIISRFLPTGSWKDMVFQFM